VQGLSPEEFVVSASGGNSPVRFGTFEVDLRAGELRRNGARVRLQEQPLQVLAMLLDRPGEVVTREELHGRLWSSDTFVDFDHGLNAAIKRLRDALGDSAENPRFVETLARRGYRFIAPVEKSQPAFAAPADTTPPESTSRFRRWLPILVSALGVLLVGASAGWHAGRHSAAALRPMERRITGNAPNDPVWSAAISPDGKYLAFSDKNGLFLRVLASGETQHVAIADDLRTGHVSWFPDGNRLLAVRGKWPGGSPGLWSLSTLGGSPRKLIDDAEEGAVSPDGAQVAFVRGEWEHQEVWLMQSDGEQPRKIFGEKDGSYGSPVWSPDGKRIALFEYANYFGKDQDDVSLAICDPATGRVEIIKENPNFVPGLNWTRDGRLIFALSEAPPNRADSNLWAQKMDPHSYKPIGDAVRLSNGPDSKSRMTLSSNGKRLSYLRFVASPAVYVARVQANGSILGTPQRLSLEERKNFPYTWTPDGKSIIFVSDRNGLRHLYKQGVEQAAPDLLVGGDNNIMIARLDAEGTNVLYLTTAPPNDPTQNMRLMRQPLSGGTPQLILRAPGISNFQCARIPAQTCVLSQVADNRIVFSTFDPATGNQTKIHSMDDPEWFLLNWTLSSDGHTLALAKKHRSPLPADILLLNLEGGKQRSLVLDNWFSIGCLDFAADGKSIWVNATSLAGVQTLLNVNLHGKVTAALEEKEMDLGWAIPSPNGRDVAIWMSAASSNAYLLEDF
jgi:DNA-binding winged helix-turn-helix (wHTH) protein/Tol biopolymer transport system component